MKEQFWISDVSALVFKGHNGSLLRVTWCILEAHVMNECQCCAICVLSALTPAFVLCCAYCLRSCESLANGSAQLGSGSCESLQSLGAIWNMPNARLMFRCVNIISTCQWLWLVADEMLRTQGNDLSLHAVELESGIGHQRRLWKWACLCASEVFV